jgi:Protein of unknown function (DUF751)
VRIVLHRVKPLGGLLKRPVTAVAVLVGLTGLFFFIKYTVSSMLGLEEPFVYQY